MNINSISLKQLGSNGVKLEKSIEYERDRKFVEDAFADDAILDCETVIKRFKSKILNFHWRN